MSTETAILVAVRELRTEVAERLAALERQQALLASRLPDIPERMTTAEARRYAGVTANSLYRWRDAGRLTFTRGRRPWSRSELDQVLAGQPPAETRGRRRVA